MRRTLLQRLLLMALLFALAGSALSQTATTGQVTGTITDPTGAVVPSATVTLTSDTGVNRNATSDAAGRYVFPLLPPGEYTVSCNAKGFAVVKMERVTVKITETALVNVALKVAAGGEVLTVTAAPALVNTENAAAGQVVEQETIKQLPLPTRNFTQLLTLTPGTTGSLANSSELGRGDATISVNGARTTSNAIVVNGMDASSIGTGSTPNIAVPATDTLQEFIVQTSLYDATQGRNVGGVVAAVTRSGSNKIHGAAWEFLRNDALNANNFFLKKQDTPRPVYRRNQFGGDIGGPIIKDKAWYFLSYQGTRETNGTSLLNSLSTVVVPNTLTDDRSAAALGAIAGVPALYVNPISLTIFNAKLPNGQ
ncbi:MAG TPA: carboxypeptidase-like regulatory domain-containing protein, partial [Terriglobales bacterium]